MLRWNLGDVEISQVVELEGGVGAVIQSIIKNASRENIRAINWLKPNFADGEGNLKSQVQSFLIKTEGKKILVDACIGNGKVRTDIPAWGNLKTDYLARLARAGASPAEIDIVACTHLHVDHVGWNTKLDHGQWVPTFPNATYLFGREEYDYWKEEPAEGRPDHKAAFDDSVSPLVQRGMAKMVSSDHRIAKHIRFSPAPGHTPGHLCVLLESDSQKAVISGDFIHHPCQVANPHWAVAPDALPEKAIETRERLLDQMSQTHALLLGSHFANPVAGYVIRAENGFVFRT